MKVSVLMEAAALLLLRKKLLQNIISKSELIKIVQFPNPVVLAKPKHFATAHLLYFFPCVQVLPDLYLPREFMQIDGVLRLQKNSSMGSNIQVQIKIIY